MSPSSRITGVLNRRGNLDTDTDTRRTLCEDEGTDHGEASIHQGTPMFSRSSGKRHGTDPFCTARRNQPYWHLDLGHLASRTVTMNFCSLSSQFVVLCYGSSSKWIHYQTCPELGRFYWRCLEGGMSQGGITSPSPQHPPLKSPHLSLHSLSSHLPDSGLISKYSATNLSCYFFRSSFSLPLKLRQQPTSSS